MSPIKTHEKDQIFPFERRKSMQNQIFEFFFYNYNGRFWPQFKQNIKSAKTCAHRQSNTRDSNNENKTYIQAIKLIYIEISNVIPQKSDEIVKRYDKRSERNSIASMLMLSSHLCPLLAMKNRLNN